MLFSSCKSPGTQRSWDLRNDEWNERTYFSDDELIQNDSIDCFVFISNVKMISTYRTVQQNRYSIMTLVFMNCIPLTECGTPCFVPGPLNRPRVQAAGLRPLVSKHHHAPCQPGSTLWHWFTIQLAVQLRLSQLQPVQHWGEEEQLNNVTKPVCSAEHSRTHRSAMQVVKIINSLHLSFQRWTDTVTYIKSKLRIILFLNWNIKCWWA